MRSAKVRHEKEDEKDDENLPKEFSFKKYLENAKQ